MTNEQQKPEMNNDKKLEQDKQAFFAQYWGQNVFCIKTHFITDEVPFNESGIEIDQHIFPIKLDRKVYGNVESRDYYLELTDLRNITDDHAIEVVYMIWPKDRGGRVDLEFAKGPLLGAWATRRDVADFLRRNGYLLPYAGYTTDQILSMGWVKLKTN
jgi:hypothetical protein